MASYKVPQDVEADDKLLGPFSFRQFVYIMIAAGAIAIAYFLFRLLPPLVIIPVPIILFFGALALPLRKDQPMEIYMAAILSFYLKPRSRLWQPDGIETLVQIAAPRTTEPQRTKNVSESEAEQRLRYLSDLSDSRGWSVRGIHDASGSSMNADVFNEAQQTQDVLDENNAIAQTLNQMISQSDQRRHQEMVSRFQSAANAPAQAPPQAPPIPDPYAALSPQPQPVATPQVQPPAPVATPAPAEPNPFLAAAPTVPTVTPETPQFNPYPTNMNQTVIQPLAQPQPQEPPQTLITPTPEPVIEEPAPATSAPTISPDIMKLATNADLSIETIAREAHRITEKEATLNDDEVVISLR